MGRGALRVLLALAPPTCSNPSSTITSGGTCSSPGSASLKTAARDPNACVSPLVSCFQSQDERPFVSGSTVPNVTWAGGYRSNANVGLKARGEEEPLVVFETFLMLVLGALVRIAAAVWLMGCGMRCVGNQPLLTLIALFALAERHWGPGDS